ncbi:N-acetylglucosamine-6-phosphate deacetylase [Endozoicomonas sp. (ex Bugula neritina AB1)]|nr:N-acetylglucosamine-6-phosphate deacetylase [Endozoicomonas sp. (ex Bugula neritina AB1)]
MIEQPSYILTNFRLLNGEAASDKTTPEAVHIQGSHIQAVGLLSDMPADIHKVDAKGYFLSPGFIDLQLNGCGGVLFNGDISAKTLDIMHDTNRITGCTAFLPTLITSSDDDILKAIEVVRAYRKKHPERVPGLHLEGPYLNIVRKGIHEEKLIRKPSQTMIDLLCANADAITKITLAPEKTPAGVIEKLVNAGIIVSIGHTNATCAEAKQAEKAGARFVTHLHNAMTPLTSREPGVIGAAFDSDVMYAGIIADGYHLSWENLRIAHKIMQDRLVLVTDAVTPAGTDIAEFNFAGKTIFHSKGKCTGPDGTLAGSALTMIEAVTNSIGHGIDRNAVIRMATINAAKSMGIEDQMGSIAAGQFANLTLLDDSLIVKGSISGGSALWYTHQRAPTKQ